MLGSGPAINLQKMPILAKNFSFWSWRICKQAKLSHLGHRKPARVHWKANALKTSHYLVRVLVHHWTIFLWKWVRRGRYIQRRALSGHFECIFVHKNWRGGYWQHLVSTGRQYVLHSSMFWALFLKFALSEAELMSFDHLEVALWDRLTIICGVPPSQRQLTL